MTWLKDDTQHSQHPKKYKKQPKTRRKVIQAVLASGWQKIQGLKQREIAFISKIVRRKRKCSD